MVDILAFYSGLAFALRDSSASLISGSTILDLVRLTLIPIILLPIVARVSWQLLSSLTLAWLSLGKAKVVGITSSRNQSAGS
jgi:hypothetical protein